MAKKIGEDLAKEFFRKGFRELGELGHFHGSNIAQPHIGLPQTPERGQEPTPDRGPEMERER